MPEQTQNSTIEFRTFPFWLIITFQTHKFYNRFLSSLTKFKWEQTGRILTDLPNDEKKC